MPSESPTLSTKTRSSETRTSSNSALNTTTTANFNYQELFDDVDWSEVNLIDIEREWRNELDQIEKDNVQALMDSTSKAQLVLPAVFKAIDDMTKLSETYEKYTNDLRVTGMEIQQIESLNRGLETQTRNLEKLLEEVEKIISLVALPDGVLEILQSMPLDVPASVPKIEKAAQSLYDLLNVKFEGGIQDIKAISDRLRYYNEQHDLFAKRLVKFFKGQFNDIITKQSSAYSARTFVSSHLTSPNTITGALSLPRHDEFYTFLTAYKSLLLLCRHQSPREHLEICTEYQNAMGNLVSKDLGRFFETLKANHLLKRPNPDPSELFVNPNLKVPQFSLNVGRTYLPSNKNFSAMRLFKAEDLPFLGDSEFVYPDQALQFIILTVAMNMNTKKKLISELLLGYSLPDDPNTIDLKMSKKILAIQGVVFASLGERLPQFIEQCIKLDESSSIDILTVLDMRVPQCLETVPIFGKILEAIQQKVYNYSELFLESQIEAIKATKYSAKKRSGIFVYVETFPRFVTRIETILRDSGVIKGCSSRVLIDRYYEKIGQTIFDSFVQLSGEVEEGDEKGHINASVMTIENSYYLFKKLGESNLTLESILRSSKNFYETSLSSYARLSIYRAVGKYAEYFDGLSNLLKTTAPEEVAFTSTYSKASVKKVIQASPFKELKKSIELLRQRTVKHFHPHPKLTEIVWTAVKEDFLKRERAMKENLAKVFPGAVDVKTAHTIEDIDKYFTQISK